MKLTRPLTFLLGSLLFAPSAGGGESQRVRVLSYNIHHGRGTDDRVDLERVARVVRSASPDLVALQEVDKNVGRSGAVDQPAELARLTGMEVVFGGNIALQGGEYGNAILSRWDFRGSDNLPLPNHDSGEQRGLLAADLSPGGGGVSFLATHFDHRRDDSERIASAAQINTLVAGDRIPTILAGDLNATRGSAVLRSLAEQWVVAGAGEQPTVPVAEPVRQIDFVLVRPADRWRVVETRVLDEAVASDHRAVLAVLELLPEVAGSRLPRDQPLLVRDRDGGVKPARSADGWQSRRAEILSGMQLVMGQMPRRLRREPPGTKVVEEADCGSYVRRLIAFESQAGCMTPAYLCVPKLAMGEGAVPVPAVLCLHPTDDRVGHGVVVGLGGKPNRQYAAELAQRGYVTIAPSYPLLAGYQPDLETLGWQSGTLQAVWDNMRAIDLLQSLPYVEGEAIGAIGHSLGGHNAVFTAVFDLRVKAVVSSCGLDSFLDYYGGDPEVWTAGKGWTSRRYMPRLAAYAGRLEEIPFDFHELIAALAPRPTLIVAPEHDHNFRADSVDRVAAAARAVFELYGHAGRLRVEHPDGGHDFPDDMRELAYEMFDEVLRGR